jgi:NAD(P)-dependent dehydrogenase (short-subunit alcohol dehydrogenase family)
MPNLVITGANRGLGLEFVRRYLDLGWRIIALNRGTSPGIEALAGNDLLTVLRGDLTDSKTLGELVADTREALAGEAIDLLINNAGVMGTNTFHEGGMTRQGIHDFDRDEWRSVFEANLFTPGELTALLLDQIADDSRVVMISSMMGSMELNSFAGWMAYRASKAAVNMMVSSAALEFAERGIVTLALHPGWVRTDMGGPEADIDVETSVAGMMDVIDGLGPEDSGAFIGYDGKRLPW